MSRTERPRWFRCSDKHWLLFIQVVPPVLVRRLAESEGPRHEKEAAHEALDALSDAFVALGLGADEQPNAIGLVIEDVIDEVGRDIWE